MIRDSSPLLFDWQNASSNAFLMMRLGKTQQHLRIHAVARMVLDTYGMNLLRADDRDCADSVWANVKSYMDACDSGIAVFERIERDDFNPNVCLELGYMLAHEKPVLLLKEKTLKELPSDLRGKIYKTFDSQDISASVKRSIVEWLREIRVAKSPDERVLLFVSLGGTCRCAMAKVALQQALASRRLPYSLRVVSVAHQFGGTEEASPGARRAVREAYGFDFLERHRVIRRNPGLLADADLILTMEDKLRRGLPADKTFNFKPFLDGKGDVPNPWRGKGNETKAGRERYRACMRELRSAVDKGVDRILSYLELPRQAP